MEHFKKGKFLDSGPHVLGEFACRDGIIRTIWAGLQVVEPARVVKRAVQLHRDELRVGDYVCDLMNVDKIELLAAGKAARPMVEALVEILGERLEGGLAIVKKGDPLGHIGPVEIREAAHPVPDATSVAAASELAKRANRLGENDLAIVMISGGASALLTLPASGIELSCLQQTTDLLLRSGATIHELNAVRKHISSIKGGLLAKRIEPAKTLGLLLSDVVGDALDVIGSGPISPDPTSFSDAWDVLDKYHLLSRVPPTVIDRLERGRSGFISETPKAGDSVFRNVKAFILGSNRHACRGAMEAAKREGMETHLLSTTMQGEARTIGGQVSGWIEAIRMKDLPGSPPTCLVLGGESTVTVKGSGKGGRNQELALAAAIAIDGLKDVAVVALATDGGDGPTDAAGAIVSGTTCHRARSLGLDPRAYLDDNNAYVFFDQLGDLIRTGPTMTNVADLLFVFVY